MNTSWYLQDFKLASGAILGVSKSARLHAAFAPDGQLTIRADCNSGTGSYSVGGGNISIKVLEMSQATCVPTRFRGSSSSALAQTPTYLQDQSSTLTLNVPPKGDLRFLARARSRLCGGRAAFAIMCLSDGGEDARRGEMMAVAGKTVAAGGAGLVLLTLASGQFLMTLDSSVMNVSIATVASDLNTTVSGIQSAITLYTLVMATLMITGGKIGANIGRRRAFSIGCIIYGIGSLTTALAPNLGILLLGWSLLEGIGAALIMPAIVALVAINVAQPDAPARMG